MAENKTDIPQVPPATSDGARHRGSISHREFRLFLVAGEHSGDALGAKLMQALDKRLKGGVRYLGVGGGLMEKKGLVSQFPLEEVAVMGPLSILPRLPRLLQRISGTAKAAVAAMPDAVVIIDSPEFTHRVAKKIRRKRPDIPIVNYVSPQVWAWRPGRAARMRWYIDHMMALLPFEPEVYARLNGPPCTYVGHPLIERIDALKGTDPLPLMVRLGLDRSRPIVLVMPGSRKSEVSRLMGTFGEAIKLLSERLGPVQVLLPALDTVRDEIELQLKQWKVPVHVIEGEENKYRAFGLAHAALTASGTATLELALAGTPAVVAYRVDLIASSLRFLLTVPSIVLANLVLGENVYPEFIQERAQPQNLASALLPLLSDTPERRRQISKLAATAEKMEVRGQPPSARAAEIVLYHAGWRE
jgi:lipid-A-disaccharide synthase